MDNRGHILTQAELDALDADERAARQPIPVPDDQLPAVRSMNRHQRRAWYASQMRAKRLAAREKVRAQLRAARSAPPQREGE